MGLRKIQVVMMSVLLSGACLQQAIAQQTDPQREADEKEKKELQQNLHREMTLEKEYNPIVQDAAKVNTLPEVREMNVFKRPIVFSTYAVPMIPEKEMTVLPAGSLMTDVAHSKRNGYLHFGGGMLMNMMGDFGYHLLNTERDNLGIWFSHRSTNGKVEFDDKWELGKRKMKLNDNFGGLDFKHRFDKATLKLGGKFGYSAFNYYGAQTNFDPAINDLPTFVGDTTTNQGNQLIHVYAGVASRDETSMGYHIDAEYTNFNQKYGLSKEWDGMSENHIKVDLGIHSPSNNGKYFGVDLGMNVLSYTETEPVFVLVPDSIDVFGTHFNATLSPYFRAGGNTWKLWLGANVSLVSQNDETDVFVSPNIQFETSIANWSVFYADFGGGVQSNSSAEITRTNRYFNPVFTADASKTWADLQIGVRSSPAAGLWFDIFAGYKYTESDLFFNPSAFQWIGGGFNNVSMAFQPTSQRIQAGATLKYDYKQLFDFYLRGVYNHYNLDYTDSWKNQYGAVGLTEDDEIEAYGRPSFTANVGVNVRPVKPLTVSLDYSLMSGSYAYLKDRTDREAKGVNEKMSSVNDLRLRASWQFHPMFSVYAQFNNLLFQKSELYYGYPLQPFSAMGGFCFNF